MQAPIHKATLTWSQLLPAPMTTGDDGGRWVGWGEGGLMGYVTWKVALDATV